MALSPLGPTLVLPVTKSEIEDCRMPVSEAIRDCVHPAATKARALSAHEISVFMLSIIGKPNLNVNRQTELFAVQNAAMGNTLGQRIKKCRKECGLTQKQVQSRTGISQGNLSELENDEYPTSSFVPQLAQLFGVNALWLATGEGLKHPRQDELSDLALSIARDVMQLPKEKQLELKTWSSVEVEIKKAKERQAEIRPEQDRKTS
jgi:transcriptional regulator with XRE-family HTH domain